MNYDVAYYINDKHSRITGMRKRVDSNSITLGVMSPCQDKYWDKKTIFNILGMLKPTGMLAVVTDFDSIGSIIAIAKEENFKWHACCFCQDKNISFSAAPIKIIIFITKTYCSYPNLIVDNVALSEMLITSSTTSQDVVLVVGNRVSDMAMEAKRTCRSVICFLETKSEFLENEGIRMEGVESAI